MLTVEIMVPLEYLSNFLRTLEMSLINCKINLVLTGSKTCVITSNASANQKTIFAVIDAKKLCFSWNSINSRWCKASWNQVLKKTIN